MQPPCESSRIPGDKLRIAAHDASSAPIKMARNGTVKVSNYWALSEWTSDRSCSIWMSLNFDVSSAARWHLHVLSVSQHWVNSLVTWTLCRCDRSSSLIAAWEKHEEIVLRLITLRVTHAFLKTIVLITREDLCIVNSWVTKVFNFSSKRQDLGCNSVHRQTEPSEWKLARETCISFTSSSSSSSISDSIHASFTSMVKIFMSYGELLSICGGVCLEDER